MCASLRIARSSPLVATGTVHSDKEPMFCQLLGRPCPYLTLGVSLSDGSAPGVPRLVLTARALVCRALRFALPPLQSAMQRPTLAFLVLAALAFFGSVQAFVPRAPAPLSEYAALCYEQPDAQSTDHACADPGVCPSSSPRPLPVCLGHATHQAGPPWR
jgi:hypothetical protein